MFPAPPIVGELGNDTHLDIFDGRYRGEGLNSTMTRLANKIALITGAGSGIGQSSALLFAREGASVVVNDLDHVKGEETVRLIQQSGG